MNLALLLIFIFILNIPFGYWRGNVTKFSLQWFLAIHLPVPLIISVRFLTQTRIEVISFIIGLAVFLIGQYFGKKIFITRKKSGQQPLTSCLVMDLVRSDYE